MKITSTSNSPGLSPTSMYAANLTITTGASDTSGSTAFGVAGSDCVWVKPYFTGNASTAGGVVTFYFAFSLDGTTFDTGVTPVAVTIASGVQAGMAELSTRGANSIKCVKVTNGDAGYSVTACNVQICSYQ